MLEYPRPQFKRTSFYCLNGQWTLNNKPIIVPFDLCGITHKGHYVYFLIMWSFIS